MDRRKFFKYLLIGTSAALITPKLFVQEKKKIKRAIVLSDTNLDWYKRGGFITIDREEPRRITNIYENFPHHLLQYKIDRIISLGGLL